MNKPSELTIIIATYNRSKKVQNFLEFISTFNINVNVVIADGSTNINEKFKNIKIIKSFPEIKIKYFYSTKNPHIRMFLAIKQIKSKYYKISSDDDFFTSEFINFSIKTLNKNKKIKSVSGNELIVKKSSNNLIYEIDNIDKSKYFKNSIFFETGNGPCSHLFNVYRYKDLYKILYIIKEISKIVPFETNLNNKFITWWFQELIYKYYIYQSGSIIHSKYISHIRIDHNDVWGMRSHNLNFLNFSFPQNLQKIFDLINKNLIKNKNSNLIKLIWLNDIYTKKNRIHYEFNIFQNRSFIEKIYNLSLEKILDKIRGNFLYQKISVILYLKKIYLAKYIDYITFKKDYIFNNKKNYK